MYLLTQNDQIQHALTLSPIIPKQERKNGTHKLRRLSAKKKSIAVFRLNAWKEKLRPTPSRRRKVKMGSSCLRWSNNYVTLSATFNLHVFCLNTIQSIEIGIIFNHDGYPVFGKLPT